MPTPIVEEVARKLGGPAVLGVTVRSQADLAQIVRNRLPLAALKGLSHAGLTEQEIELFVIPQTDPPASGRQEATPYGRGIRSRGPAPAHPIARGRDVRG